MSLTHWLVLAACPAHCLLWRKSRLTVDFGVSEAIQLSNYVRRTRARWKNAQHVGCLRCFFCVIFALTRLHTISLCMSDDSNNILFCSISILFPGEVYSSIQLDRSDIFLQYNKGCREKKKKKFHVWKSCWKRNIVTGAAQRMTKQLFQFTFWWKRAITDMKKKKRFWNVNETFWVNFHLFANMRLVESRCSAELLWRLRLQFSFFVVVVF